MEIKRIVEYHTVIADGQTVYAGESWILALQAVIMCLSNPTIKETIHKIEKKQVLRPFFQL